MSGRPEYEGHAGQCRQNPTLFDLDAPAWSPVYLPRGGWEARGVDALHATNEEWSAFRASHRCRDCGLLIAKAKRTHSCGGGDALGQYELCDDCAAVDGCDRRHSADPSVHVSMWGLVHSQAEHDRLVAEREKRRAKYRREVGS